jgi:isoaspartyl peptidase/L-asparaginase-like protein (Ntn-hydrolase superfamily)
MTTRRKFLSASITASAAAMMGLSSKANQKTIDNYKSTTVIKPLIISTWHHGIAANEAAWQVLIQNGSALDAVEAGVRVTESDPTITSVGYGGSPDSDGHVTLDACIMDHLGNAGSVAFLENIMHPVSVARKVMELTPHVMLVGDGALMFALENGFEKENLLTPEAERKWREWLNKREDVPQKINEQYHDTIGMLAIDTNGNLSGACSTSGVSYKYRGRVGDSPIIGAGLFVDNEVGAASATGLGEAIIKIAGSHLIVELMRQGDSPKAACKIAVERILKKQKITKQLDAAFIAVNKAGETGAFALRKGFQYALYQNNENRLIDCDFLIE